MKLKKILLASATVAAFSAVMSISALAANYNLTGIEYKPAEGNNPAYVKVANAPEFADGSSYTMLILNTNNGAVLTAIENTDIKQIGEETVSYKGQPIPVALEEGATYEVRMGGDGNLWTGTFTVPKATPDNPWASSTKLLGDADGNGAINGSDSLAILNYEAGNECDINTKELVQAADADDNGAVNGSDALFILNNEAGNDKTLGSITVAKKTNYVTEYNAGITK